MTTFASVFVRGHRKQYAADWVRRLHDAADRHTTENLRHVCLTDRPDQIPPGIEAIDIGAWWRPLRAAGLKGWWAKIALFKPGLFPFGERILAVDIDNLILGDLDAFMRQYADKPAVMAPHSAPGFNPPGTVNNFSSTVMLWKASAMDAAWHKWSPSITKKFRGDQDYLSFIMPNLPTFDMSYMQRIPQSPDRLPRPDVVFCVGGRVKPNEAAATRAWAKAAWQ